MIIPFTSIKVSPGESLNTPTSAILPSRMRRLPSARAFPVPSITEPLMSTTFCENAGNAKTKTRMNDAIRRMLYFSGIIRRGLMKITRYVRYSAAGTTSYGIIDGRDGREEQTIRELRGNIYTGAEATGRTLCLSDVKLLAPCEPSK